VELWRLQAVAEIAIWEPRPELQHLCRAAEHGSTFDSETLMSLVPGLSTAGAHNLAAHLDYIGLTRENGLTRLGKSCAATGMAPAWEFGVYDFLIANHPLVGSAFLDLQRTVNNPEDYDFKSLTALPAWLDYDRDQVHVSAYDNSRRFSIYEIPKAEQGGNCRCVRLDDGELQITVRDLRTGENDWRIQGQGDAANGAGGRFSSPPEALPSALFAGLLARWDRRWDPRNNYLAIGFDGQVDPLGRDQFRRRMTYPNVAIKSPNGDKDIVFPSAEVDDVPVGPSSAEEALRWAVAIAAARLSRADSYATKDDWNRLWEAEIANSSLGKELNREVTMAEGLSVAEAKLSPRTRWLLSACADLEVE
jgi:hypothetical protein